MELTQCPVYCNGGKLLINVKIVSKYVNKMFRKMLTTYHHNTIGIPCLDTSLRRHVYVSASALVEASIFVPE